MPTQTSAIALQREIKRFLKRVAVKFAEFLKHKIGIKYPPSSRIGEYPRKRTGSLQASAGYKMGSSGSSILIGIIRDVRLNGKKAAPTRYGAILEYHMLRKLTMDAWEEFWPTIDHRLNVKLGAGLTRTLIVNRLTKNHGDKEEFFEIEGLNEFLEERPSIYAREMV